MFDYHVHSTVSYDGRGTPEEMAAAALRAGLTEICFTDHLDYLHCVPRSQTTFTPQTYAAAYDRLAVPGLAIRTGTEVGLTPWNQAEIEKDLRAHPYDFVLGSLHFIRDEDPYLPPYWVGRDPLMAERDYYRELITCLKIHDNFDVLGHLTYIGKCKAHPCPRIIPLEDYREIMDEIFKVLIAKGKGLEINTSGVDLCGDFLPGIAFLRRFRELGGEIVTVGSDAHDASRMGQYIPQALAIAKEVFGHVCTFANREPIFHKL